MIQLNSWASVTDNLVMSGPPKKTLASRQWSCKALTEANMKVMAVKKEEPTEDERIQLEIEAPLPSKLFLTFPYLIVYNPRSTQRPRVTSIIVTLCLRPLVNRVNNSAPAKSLQEAEQKLRELRLRRTSRAVTDEALLGVQV